MFIPLKAARDCLEKILFHSHTSSFISSGAMSLTERRNGEKRRQPRRNKGLSYAKKLVSTPDVARLPPPW